MALGLVSQYIAQLIRRRLDQYSIVVWYDPERSFSELVDSLDLPEGTRVARFTGSYFELRADVDQYFANMTRNPGTISQGLLIYVPTAPLPREMDLLLCFSASGTLVKEDLATLAREALRDRFSEGDLASILSNSALSLAELDRIALEGTNGPANAVISLLFGPVAIHEVWAKYLTNPQFESAVAEKNALPALEALAIRTLGLPAQGDTDQARFKRRLARHLLVTDFRASLPENVRIPSLSAMSIPKPEHIAACRQTADYMRQRLDMQAAYKQLAEQVEQDFNLRQVDLPASIISDSETFPFVDDVCLRQLEDLVQQGNVDDAKRLAVARLESFWARADQRRKVQWQIALAALELYYEAGRVAEEVRVCTLSPEGMVRAYTERTSGWYRLDRLQRTLESRLAEMEDEFQLHGLLHLARQAYQNTVQMLADRFLDSIKEHGFIFGSVLPQTNIYRQYVEPHLDGGPVAYVLVDALRYEMGVELLRLLDRAEEADVIPAIAAVPTITVVGMAALMPGAEKGISIVTTTAGKVAAQVGPITLAGANDRAKLLSSATGDTVLDITLDDFLNSSRYSKPAQLKKHLVGKRLIVLRAIEIDAEGESDLVMPARRGITRVLADLKKAIYRLAAAGVEHFVVAADHGFLFGEGIHEAMKTDPPTGGEEILLLRRCWVGRGGDNRPTFVRFKAADLGMGGDLEFAFPRGLGVFKSRGGGSNYFHGGLSLQELVVPVLSFRMAAPVASGSGESFEVRIDPPRVTNRFFMATVSYWGNLFSPSQRRVRLDLTVDGNVVGYPATAKYGYDPASQEITLEKGQENAVTLFFGGEQTHGSFHVQLKDAETGAVLAQQGPIPFEFTS